MSHGTRQIRLICEWDFGLTCLADPHRLEKSCLSKRPTKTAQTGVGSRSGVVSFPSLQKPHTGPHRWDSEEIRLCCQLVFRISSFSSPFQKVLFFVYAAQFLHRAILSSSTLITFYRTLLEYHSSLFFLFPALRKNALPSSCLKIGPNRCCYGFGYCFPASTGKASHKSTQLVTQGAPAWLSYPMLFPSVHPARFSPTVAGRIAPLLPGSDGW